MHEIGVDIGEAPELGLVDAGQNQAVRGQRRGRPSEELVKVLAAAPHCGKHRGKHEESERTRGLIHPLRGQRVVPGRGLTGRGLNGGAISNRSSLSQSIQRKKPWSTDGGPPSGPEPRRLAGCLVRNCREHRERDGTDRQCPRQGGPEKDGVEEAGRPGRRNRERQAQSSRKRRTNSGGRQRWGWGRVQRWGGVERGRERKRRRGIDEMGVDEIKTQRPRTDKERSKIGV